MIDKPLISLPKMAKYLLILSLIVTVVAAQPYPGKISPMYLMFPFHYDFSQPNGITSWLPLGTEDLMMATIWIL